MRVLWFAMMMNVLVFFGFTIIIERQQPAGDSSLTLVFALVALSTTALSFVVRSKLLNSAVKTQQVQGVQVAFIVAWAMCEVSALLGIMDYLTVGGRSYILLFVISELGMILHFPKYDHLAAASVKKPW
jgi:hypothetical protein